MAYVIVFFPFFFPSPLSQEIKPMKSSSTEISGKPLIEFRISLNQRVFCKLHSRVIFTDLMLLSQNKNSCMLA